MIIIMKWLKIQEKDWGKINFFSKFNYFLIKGLIEVFFSTSQKPINRQKFA